MDNFIATFYFLTIKGLIMKKIITTSLGVIILGLAFYLVFGGNNISENPTTNLTKTPKHDVNNSEQDSNFEAVSENNTQLSLASTSNRDFKRSLKQEPLKEADLKTNEEKEYSIETLNNLINDDSNFNMKSAMSILLSDKFDIALSDLYSVTASNIEYQKITQDQTIRFNELPLIKYGNVYLEDLACNNRFCMTSLQLLGNTEWEDIAAESKGIIDMYNTITTNQKSDGISRQLVIYSITPNIEGVELRED